MAVWGDVAPDYVPPSKTTPAWVWSIVGRGKYSSGTDCLIIRLDLCILSTSGILEKYTVNLQHSALGSQCYAPIYLSLSMSESMDQCINKWASSTPTEFVNQFWKGFIWKILHTMPNSMGGGWYPLYVPAP